MKFTLLLTLCILVTCYADDTNAQRERRSSKSSGRNGSSRSGNSNSSGRSSSRSGNSNSSGRSSSSSSGNSKSSGKSSSSSSGNSKSSGKSSSSSSGNSKSSGKSSSSRSGNLNSSGKSSSSGSSSSNKPTGGFSSSRNRSPGRSSSSSSSIVDLRKTAFANGKDSGSHLMNYAKNYYQGAKEMVKSYQEMRKANVIGSDKYFHAKGNFNAAKFGPGGAAAAEDISNLREATDTARYKVSNILGKMSDSEYNNKIADSKKDQEANTWGRSGGDPNKYRVNGIPNDM